MTHSPAPFRSDLADGPKNGQAYWIVAKDGVRIRIAVWPAGAARGTVLLFPGRTEYVEKYGRTAADLTARGFNVVAIDWRGQGMADRLHDDPMLGHVHVFDDYQTDVQAVLQTVRALGLEEPFFLLAHSMGGAIGLRALHNDLPVLAAAFSAPMWGIRISPVLRPVAWALGSLSKTVGKDTAYAPGTKPASYVVTEPFDDNTLTRDPDMWTYMQHQAKSDERFQLGGPSLRWLHEALAETLELSRQTAPDVPTLTFLGSNERIVDVPRIYQRMETWPKGALRVINDAEHEVLMERPLVRRTITEELTEFFNNPAVFLRPVARTA